MRSTLFRTTTLVDDSDVVVALKDVDGAGPLAVFVENVDVPARLSTRYGSKDANLTFTAVAPGTGGNALRVVIGSVASAPADQAFAVETYAGVVTVTLRTDGSGRPNMLARDVMDALNADPDTAAVVSVSLARGSDGTAVMGLLSDTDPEDLSFDELLSGGLTAQALTNVRVATSPTGAPEFAGPWTDADAYAFDVPAGGVVAVEAGPARGLRVTADAASDTMVSVTAVAQRPL